MGSAPAPAISTISHFAASLSSTLSQRINERRETRDLAASSSHRINATTKQILSPSRKGTERRKKREIYIGIRKKPNASTVIYSASNQRILTQKKTLISPSLLFFPQSNINEKMAEVEVTPAAEVVSEEPTKATKGSPTKDPAELKRKLHDEDASPEKKQKKEETITNGKEEENGKDE